MAYAGGAWAPVAVPGGSAPGSDALQWGMRRSALNRLAQMGDKELLQLTSTSPEAEEDGYVDKMREILGFISQHL